MGVHGHYLGTGRYLHCLSLNVNDGLKAAVSFFLGLFVEYVILMTCLALYRRSKFHY